MSYKTVIAPCGHHVKKLTLIAKTKVDPEHSKSAEIWECECEQLFTKLGGMLAGIDRTAFDVWNDEGLLEMV